MSVVLMHLKERRYWILNPGFLLWIAQLEEILWKLRVTLDWINDLDETLNAQNELGYLILYFFSIE